MKLTKKLEAEILKAYHAYWDSYLIGDMETFASILDKECHIIGSTAFDIFDNKKDAVEFYTATANQIAGIGEMRNRKIDVLPYDDNVMVQELYDYFFLHEAQWHFYGHGRISTLFSKKKGSWKITHQHGSLPDSKAEEGEQVGTEKISQENQQLRDAIKRRTAELEIKNRELEIESSLERVRTVAMSMNKPDDMLFVCQVISRQLELLNVKEIRNVQTAIFYESKGTYLNYEYYRLYDKSLITEVVYVTHPVSAAFADQMLKGPEEFFTKSLNGKELKEWYAFQQSTNQFADTHLENASSLNYYFYSMGPVALGVSTYSPLNEEEIKLFKRFRNVFELSYRRFLDIEKATAQAKEAQIETALEKVRSRSLAMQKSEELKEVIQVVYEQFIHLNVNTEHTGFVIDYKQRDDRLIWVAGKRGIPSQLTIPYFDCEYYNSFNEAKEKGWNFFATNLGFEEKNNFYRELFKYIPGLPADEKEFYFNCPGLAISTVLLENVALYIENFEGIPYSDEDNAILMRFGKVFQQTYTRFLDLQKAEAQAREATIETALEKVRSRSLAMHKSDEIGEVVWIIVEKMKELNIEAQGISVTTFIPGTKDLLHWHANAEMAGEASTMMMRYFDDLIFNDCINARDAGAELLVKQYSKEEKNNYINSAIEYTDFKYFPEELKQWILEQPFLNFSFAIQKHSGIFLEDYTGKSFSKDENDILVRFAKVFEQAYVRFLDLQKAETQAREAKIEAALERTRTQSMIMQHSNELDDSLKVFHEQVLLLGINSAFSYLWLPDEKNDRHIFWAAWAEDLPAGQAGKNGSTVFKSKAINYPLDRNEPATAQCLVDWKSDETVYSYHILPGAVKNYFAVWQELLDGVEHLKPEHFSGGLQYVEAFMKYGCFGVIVTTDLTEDEKKLLGRFAIEFERTYTRFLDLQKAEAQARESQIEASLERVRAKAMSMHRSEDLHAAVAIVFEELEKLDIGVLRCGISVLNKEKRCGKVWLTSTDQGKAVQVTGDESFDIHPLLHGAFEAWLKQEDFYYVLEGEDLVNYYKAVNNAKFMLPESQLLISETKVKQYCFVAVYNSGGLFTFQETAFTEEAKKIMRRFANVFDLTYKRFLDLQNAEAHSIQAQEDLVKLQTEKKRAEDALTELRSTQKQLIQSEKMASLGELTAGIAHEIQNPLNFVNNFSEVSVELIREMVDEVEKGNAGEAKAIADDLVQNLEKINHHGKRADAIVKGMLQHSRSSSAVKEPTDINALADEYLRLSYHGLRAKDKSFNATLKTDFDETIGTINIIPQDIGRAILNLITNAFYVVDEKKKSGIENYEPTVSVSTKKENGRVEISVTDNGNGIPSKVLDKIFQPFFTTKPTGQGTGLGLSLSYDIIKAHGGELKVETKEKEGTTFTVQLPLA